MDTLFLWLVVIVGLFAGYKDVSSIFWPKFKQERSFQHLIYATLFALFILWSADAGVKTGLSIHFLALTTVTLMHGPHVAFLLAIFVSIGLVVIQQLALDQLAQQLVFSGLIPILISQLIFLASYRFLPRNIFIYIFVAGFFNGAITGCLHLIINSGYYWLTDAYDWKTIVDNYFIFTPLLAFPEGLLNGMSVAMLCVFKPEWLRSFSDRDYIYNHYHKK